MGRNHWLHPNCPQLGKVLSVFIFIHSIFLADFAPLLVQLKILYFEEFLNIQRPLMELLINWLHSTTQPNEWNDFRMLLCIVSNSVLASLIREIQQVKKVSIKFSVFLEISHHGKNCHFFCACQNHFWHGNRKFCGEQSQTGERLSVERMGTILIISRHLNNANSVWLASKKEEAFGWQFAKQKRRLTLRQKF